MPAERWLLGLIGGFLLPVSCAGLTSPSSTPSPTPPAPKPSFVVIVADDLEVAGIEVMPKLDALLTRQGTSFSHSFVTTPLCCPARASLLTGQYSHNHGVRDNAPPLGGFEVFSGEGTEHATLAVWLRAGGYRTGLVGKYLNGYERSDPAYVPPGWDAWNVFVASNLEEGDPAAYFDYSVSENGVLRVYGDAAEDYSTDVMAQRAAQFVRETPSTRPFFLVFTPSAPHLPAHPAPRHEQALPDHGRAPRGPSFNEEDVSDKPTFVRDLGRLTDRDLRRIDAEYRRRRESLLALDEAIEAIVQALATSGRLQNTYLLFTSDNGFLQGQHRLPRGKRAAYEESIRVPLIVRGPGVPAGRVLDHIVANIDLAPTLLSLAGLAIPDTVDGRSLQPLFASSPPAATSWRRDILIEHDAQEDVGIGVYRAVRTESHIYVSYPLRGEEELYDLRNDPFQLESLHADAPPPVRDPLVARLAALENCRGAGCRQ